MTATNAESLVIDQPGVYDIPEHVYHADPVPGGSLSSTGARKLLPPSCPARFAYERDNSPPPKAEFDLGRAAHLLVLGTGPEIVVVDAEEWRTKAVKDEVAAIRAAGAVPLRPSEMEQVQAMAASLRQHPVAAALLDPSTGDPEQSLFWIDQTGVWCRARLDFLRNRAPGRVIIPDYKTSTSASLEAIQRAIASYGYHQQAAWYLDGVKALGIADDPAFVFIVQEKTAPYLVTVVQLDPVAERIGRRLNRQAIDIYRQCVATGRWPGYADDIQLVSLPAWVERQHTEEIW